MLAATIESTSSGSIGALEVVEQHASSVAVITASSSCRPLETCVVSDALPHSHVTATSPDAILFLKAPDESNSSAASGVATSSRHHGDTQGVRGIKVLGPIPPIMSRKRGHPSSGLKGLVETSDRDESDKELAAKRACGAAVDHGTARNMINHRSVHFQCREDLSSSLVRTHIHYYDKVEAWNAVNVWWTPGEMLEIQSRENSTVGVMAFCCDHYTEQVLNLLRIARDKTTEPGTAAMYFDWPALVAGSPARGLEKDIVQGFKQRKRQVVRKVLQTQESLKTAKDSKTGKVVTAEQRCRLLSLQYEKWSYPMLRFAQVLAEGDAQAVIDDVIGS